MTYSNTGGLDHLKKWTNLILKPLINVDVNLNSKYLWAKYISIVDVNLNSKYLLAKYITIIVELILNSQKILYRLTRTKN